MRGEMTGGQTGGERKKKWIWYGALLLVFLGQFAVAVYFGGRKAGFHEDEYYSFYSTNRTAGLYEPDREWLDRESIRNEFVVRRGEGFRYGLVAQVQSWDVHPPFYYFLLHTASSLFPETFSKWIGIGVNLVAFSISFLLFTWLAFMVTKENRPLTLLAAAAYGFDSIVISGVLFIRMYEWLTVFVLLCACLHVRAMRSGDRRARTFWLPLAATCYLGFLTQYYYLIFMFFMGVGFCIWQLRTDRKPAGCIRYAVCCGLSLLLAVCSYPACLSHILRGYRGTEAVSAFINGANTWERLRFFAGLMNEYLFDGHLIFLLCLIAVMGVPAVYLAGRERKKDPAAAENRTDRAFGDPSCFLLLLFAAGGYFVVVSKTALLLYETSNRYQLPVYGIVQLLVIITLYGLGVKIAHRLGLSRRVKAVALCSLAAGFLLGDLHGLMTGRVIFLYEEDAAGLEYARAHAELPVMVLYNDATPWHVWWRSQELLQYDRLYFASEANKEEIEDGTIRACEKLIVYAADYDTQEEFLRMILESNANLEEYRLVMKEQLWSVYEFD